MPLIGMPSHGLLAIAAMLVLGAMFTAGMR